MTLPHPPCAYNGHSVLNEANRQQEACLQLSERRRKFPGPKSLCDNRRAFVGLSLAIRGMCRTYDAWNLDMPCTQCFRTGLRSSAPPALSCDSQIAGFKLQVAHQESRVTTCGSQIDRAKARAPEARHNVAQPGRAGNRSNNNSEHHRCDTNRSRIVVLTQTLKTPATAYSYKMPGCCNPSRSDRDGGLHDSGSTHARGSRRIFWVYTPSHKWP